MSIRKWPPPPPPPRLPNPPLISFSNGMIMVFVKDILISYRKVVIYLRLFLVASRRKAENFSPACLRLYKSFDNGVLRNCFPFGPFDGFDGVWLWCQRKMSMSTLWLRSVGFMQCFRYFCKKVSIDLIKGVFISFNTISNIDQYVLMYFGRNKILIDLFGKFVFLPNKYILVYSSIGMAY